MIYPVVTVRNSFGRVIECEVSDERFSSLKAAERFYRVLGYMPQGSGKIHATMRDGNGHEVYLAPSKHKAAQFAAAQKVFRR